MLLKLVIGRTQKEDSLTHSLDSIGQKGRAGGNTKIKSEHSALKQLSAYSTTTVQTPLSLQKNRKRTNHGITIK